MNTIFCDRCKKDITNKPKYKFDIKWSGLKGDGVCYAVPLENDRCSEIDICVDCYNDFKEFINAIKE